MSGFALGPQMTTYDPASQNSSTHNVNSYFKEYSRLQFSLQFWENLKHTFSSSKPEGHSCDK